MSTVVSFAPSAARVRPLRRGDLGFAAALHHSCLPHGFFPALGRRFLARYLRTYADTPHAVAFVVESEGCPLGYLVGVLAPEGHRRLLVRQHGMGLAGHGIVAMAPRPRVVVRFARTRARRYVTGLVRLAASRPAPSVGQTSSPTSPAVLAHIAVASEHRGSGAGVALVRAFEEAAVKFGASEATLLTLTGSGGAGAFYERLGWRLVGTCDDRDGVKWSRYRRALP